MLTFLKNLMGNNKSQIGIEATDTVMRAAAFIFKPNKKPVLFSAIVNGDFSDEKNISPALRKLREQLPRQIRRVILGIDYKKTIMKEINIDASLTEMEIQA